MITRSIPCRALAGVVTVLLAGCGGFVRDAPVPAVYRLHSTELPAGEALPVELRIERPTVAAGLDGDRVASFWPDGRIDYYRDARWGDDLSRVVEAALVETLARTARLRAVQGERAPFVATHVLQVDIRRFEADYSAGAPPVIRVSLGATVGTVRERRVLAAFDVVAETRAGTDTQTDVMRAFNAAFARAAADLGLRLLATVGTAAPAAPASESGQAP
jgi:ABC-type uncharacterized transport system auxiliary subunit